MLIAGAHRDAGTEGSADPRDNPETLFHQVAAMLMGRGGLPHLQLHSFADVRAPGTDVVLSSGATVRDDAFRRVARGLATTLTVAEHWLNPIPGLGGLTDVQGLAAESSGTTFLHAEVSARARNTPERRAAVLAGLAEAAL